MRILPSLLLSLCGIGGVAVQGAEIAFVPVSASGEHVLVGQEIQLVGGGQTVMLEIRISGWDPDLDGTPTLKAWQVNLDSTCDIGGPSCDLTPTLVTCGADLDPDATCVAAFGGHCSMGGNACTDDGDCIYGALDQCQGSRCSYPLGAVGPDRFCEPGFIDSNRPEYVFWGEEDLPTIDLSTRDFRYASTLQAGGVTDPGVPQYAATLLLDVPPGTMGSFEIGVDDNRSVLVASDSTQLDFTVTPARIKVLCTSDSECDDGNSCTNDVCRTFCRHVANYDRLTLCCNPDTGNTCQIATDTPVDMNGDGTSDLLDVADFQSCFGGPPVLPACEPANVACSCIEEVDLDDATLFMSRLTGPNSP